MQPIAQRISSINQELKNKINEILNNNHISNVEIIIYHDRCEFEIYQEDPEKGYCIRSTLERSIDRVTRGRSDIERQYLDEGSKEEISPESSEVWEYEDILTYVSRECGVKERAITIFGQYKCSDNSILEIARTPRIEIFAGCLTYFNLYRDKYYVRKALADVLAHELIHHLQFRKVREFIINNKENRMRLRIIVNPPKCNAYREVDYWYRPHEVEAREKESMLGDYLLEVPELRELLNELASALVNSRKPRS